MCRNWTAILCVGLIIAVLFDFTLARSAETKDIKQVTCTGKVVDEQNRPIADVKIKLYKVAVETTALSYKVELARQVATGADGTFSIRSDAVENYLSNQAIILADKEGLALGWDNWRLLENANVDIVLGPAEVLAGTVVDENGAPIDSDEVSISFMLAKTGGQPRYLVGYSSIELLMTKSDTEGKFSFDRIPAGASAEFVVKKPGRATVSTFDAQGYRGGSLQYSAGQTDIKITQPIEARIEGLALKKSNGKPIGGVRIMAIRGLNQPTFGSEPVVSKEDGTFSIDRLAPGEYLLQVATALAEEADWICDPVKVDVEAGKTKNGIKVELVKGGVLEVLVTDSVTRQPVDKAIVSIMPNGGGTGFGKSTDEAGIARFRQMPGEYRISYLYKEGYSRQNLQEGTLMIEDGKTVRVERQLAGLPKITGVTCDDRGRPVEGVKLAVCPMNVRECVSNSEGRFEASWDPGSWHSSEEMPAMVLIARQPELNLAAAVDVDDNTHQIDITLKSGVISTGKVVDSNGKGISNATLLVMLQGPRWGSSIEHNIVTDAEGNYEIKALAGEHRYSIEASADGYGRNRIVVDAGQAVDNRLNAEAITLLPANLSVSGVVVDGDDKPVSSVNVSCYGETQLFGSTQTDNDGKFTLEKICAGRIRISANKTGGSPMHGFIETEGGATNVRIVISERPTVARYEPKQPPSLVGRPLPELKEVGIDLPSANADGKRLLVCFFDLEQRPSRHCITQLIKQAEQLKGKGVIVVAVQASKIDKNTLDEWAKESKVPFSVGMIQDDAEKTRFAWGVRLLPWLILTDTSHVVVSQGFSLGDLDNRLGQVGR
jgi:hypothetical protein